MALAYILIATKVGDTEIAVDEIKRLDRIQEANVYTGPYDIIAKAEADSIDEITNTLMKEIRQMPEIKKTVTCIQVDS
ncbi:hypothetical protein AKJ36_02760 [candidate division MSBL1 archaeon SCGC-AAA259I07]|uniref:Transcription regulator AsnC/Lrp ligand binding domain-containing protein n=1 Tax=candidate division MSBL1 archaeon SCGC-AAA259I07 TaxID=1698266 RepID=A0A133UK01_9EURY|nr:hypothetical protein AKJ36_02760 [candidate division MSBL1 archaeon SCGC-AAA259I07]